MLINQKEVNMLYDEYIKSGEYLAHHGVKGQKWGVRHLKETHFSYKTRQDYRKKLIADRKKSKDRDASFRKERGNIVKSHLLSGLKTGLVTAGASGLIGVGAAVAGNLIGGPAGAVAMTTIIDVGTIPLAVAGTTQSIANWVNTISRATTLSDVYKR